MADPMDLAARVARWRAATPPLTGTPHVDIEALARHTGVGDGLLAELPVKRDRHDASVHVTISNPRRLNAEDNALVADLECAADLVLLDEGAQVGVLRGGRMTHPRYHGRRVFSAGINLADLRGGRLSFVDFLM